MNLLTKFEQKFDTQVKKVEKSIQTIDFSKEKEKLILNFRPCDFLKTHTPDLAGPLINIKNHNSVL